MTLQLLHSEFPYIRGKFDFLFYQCIVRCELRSYIPGVSALGVAAPIADTCCGRRWRRSLRQLACSAPGRQRPRARSARGIGGTGPARWRAGSAPCTACAGQPAALLNKHEDFELAYSLIYSTEKNTKRTRHKNYSELLVRLYNEIERKMQKGQHNYYFFVLNFHRRHFCI